MFWWSRSRPEEGRAGRTGTVNRPLLLLLQVLLLPNNLFSSLTWSSFQVFPEIYELDLSGNQVSGASERAGTGTGTSHGCVRSHR